MFKYPYGDSQQLNLNWIIQKIKELEAGGGGGSSDLTLEEVANTLISLTYNSGTTYQRYDYCYLQGKLYRALANTSGPFDPASWMEVRIGDDIPVLTRLLNAVDASLSTLQNTVDNLDSDDIENASSQVSGTTVTNALDNLKGAINTKQDAITVITKTPNNTTCAALSSTDIETLNLSAGTWIIIGYHSWNANINSIYVDNIIDTTINKTIASLRNVTMLNGGGGSLSAFVVLTGNHTITYSTYNGDSSAQTAKDIRLIAFKIA